MGGPDRRARNHSRWELQLVPGYDIVKAALSGDLKFPGGDT
jgi:hypothetical protein